jgi:hypothetical protein
MGILAFVFPNGSRAHRRVGVAYLVCWVGIAGLGLVFKSGHAGWSAFDVLAAVGGALVLAAFACVKLKKRIGRQWKRAHYLCMIGSVAALLGPSVNQALWNLGLDYPKPVFFALIAAPWLVMPLWAMRVDATYAPKRALRDRG